MLGTLHETQDEPEAVSAECRGRVQRHSEQAEAAPDNNGQAVCQR